MLSALWHCLPAALMTCWTTLSTDFVSWLLRQQTQLLVTYIEHHQKIINFTRYCAEKKKAEWDVSNMSLGSDPWHCSLAKNCTLYPRRSCMLYAHWTTKNISHPVTEATSKINSHIKLPSQIMDVLHQNTACNEIFSWLVRYHTESLTWRVFSLEHIRPKIK